MQNTKEDIENLKCILCQSSEKNLLKYGKFYVEQGFGVHYFCLLLTSNLTQGGKDGDGILGFLHKDIINESKRVKDLKCIYCDEDGANIGCCHTKCRRAFHLICGIENGAQNQFFGTFRSFCDKDIYKSIRKQPSPTEICTICYEAFTKSDPCTMALCAPCCKNGWFHKWCLQSFANHAGYFFKCPLCNDTKKFVEELPPMGIFIPEKDADWELEPNAFHDLLERPNTCSAATCLSKSGRDFTDNKQFRLYFCYLCGSKAIHKHCKAESTSQQTFSCNECNELLNNTTYNNSTKDSGITGIEKSSNEDDIIDIEGLDESEDDIMDRFSNVRQSSMKYESDEKPINQSSPKTPVKANRAVLPKSAGFKFIETVADPKIVANVKKAFLHFESSLKLHKKRSFFKDPEVGRRKTLGFCSNRTKTQSPSRIKLVSKLNFSPCNIAPSTSTSSDRRNNAPAGAITNNIPQKIKKFTTENIRHLKKRKFVSSADSSAEKHSLRKKHCSEKITKKLILDEVMSASPSRTNKLKKVNQEITEQGRSRKKNDIHVHQINFEETTNDAPSNSTSCRYKKRTRSNSITVSSSKIRKSANGSPRKLRTRSKSKTTSETETNKDKKKYRISDSDSDSSRSSIKPIYLHNEKVLVQNAKKRDSPINKKIKSRLSSLKLVSRN